MTGLPDPSSGRAVNPGSPVDPEVGHLVPEMAGYVTSSAMAAQERPLCHCNGVGTPGDPLRGSTCTPAQGVWALARAHSLPEGSMHACLHVPVGSLSDI